MTNYPKLFILVFILTIPSTIFGQELTKKENYTTANFRTVHLINLKTAEDEIEYVAIANIFNNLMTDLGYQNIRFNFWKENGSVDGQFKYIFESNWPDKETYDKVHEHEKFIATKNKWYPKFKEKLEEDVYNRYVLLN